MTDMPICRELQLEEFQPSQAEAISRAFDEVLEDLGLIERSDPVVTIVAKRVVEFAKQGELEPERLRGLVVTSFRA